ncbi:MAG: SRPBCC family protein [Kaistella sp.]|nr:SRPBCC family protein [Kaistella sp.]
MALIKLTTRIKNTPQICFDLSRSIDLHKISTAHTNESAVDGCTQGLINLNEFVTWEAVHFGIKQRLTTKITVFNFPSQFRDEQIKGIFKFMRHDHLFEEDGNETIMTDIFHFQSPLGFLGNVADKLVVTKYMTRLLAKRNETIKAFAENGEWKSVL